MIEVRDLHKQFGTVAAVDGVSFTAPNGAITGLLGRNGAGKTTTLAMICGLVQPDTGAIQLGPPDDAAPLERRRRLGALLDHKGLYERLTARENIAYFGALHGLSAERLDRQVQDVVARLGLERIADRPAAGFSQGERMKVALARAIVHAPPHLLLDEPTNGLDIPTVHGLRQLLRTMASRGACIVFSSHVLSEIRELCDHVVILSAGRVVASGEASRICREVCTATLEDAFLKLTRDEEAVS
jgi:sodium transport system ATP-binding protein